MNLTLDDALKMIGAKECELRLATQQNTMLAERFQRAEGEAARLRAIIEYHRIDPFFTPPVEKDAG